MAILSQTITNTLELFGPSVASKWNVMVWGVDYWGESGELITLFEKGISESITLGDNLGKEVTKIPIIETINFTMGLDIFRSIGIWDYNFTRPTTDAEQAVYDDFSKTSNLSTTWTKQSDITTTWS